LLFQRADSRSGNNTIDARSGQLTMGLTGQDQEGFLRFCATLTGQTERICSDWKQVGTGIELRSGEGGTGASRLVAYKHVQNGTCINLSGDYGFDNLAQSFWMRSRSDFFSAAFFLDAGCSGVSHLENVYNDFLVGSGEIGSDWGSKFKSSISSVLTMVLTDMSIVQTYTIVSKHSGKCVGVPGFENGAGVTQWDCLGNEDQKWKLWHAHTNNDAGYGEENGYFYVGGKQSNKCLGVGGIQSGTQATQWDCLNAKDQQWGFVAAGDGYYKIVNKNSSYCLDVYELSQANGGPIVGWPCNGQDNQLFQVAAQ
jgi:hypothetical protein